MIKLKYQAEVKEHGRVELTVPLPKGAKVLVFLIEEPKENFDDFVNVSQSSLDFWDNPFDNEDWNYA